MYEIIGPDRRSEIMQRLTFGISAETQIEIRKVPVP